MLSKEKIRIMAQAAAYEKRYFRRDLFASRYYKNDYIGMERLKTKIWMTIFFGVYLAGYLFNLVYIEQIDLLHFDYRGFVFRAVVIYLLLGFVISLITSWVYGQRYDKASKRLDAYYRQLDKIDTKN